MHRWATKSQPEREDEESERLVRPAPKQKPPRHDRRRNRVDPDKESDPDQEADKDLSKNYKDVGGSVGARVVRRYVAAHLGQRVATRYLIAKGERVPARSKETGKVVLVSPDTLKERADEYEPVEEDEEPTQEDDSEPERDEPEGEGGQGEVGEIDDAMRKRIEQKIEQAEKEWQAWDDWNTRQEIEEQWDQDEIEDLIERVESFEPDEDGEEPPKIRIKLKDGWGSFDVDLFKEFVNAPKPEGSEPDVDPTGMTVEEWVEEFGLPDDEDEPREGKPKDESKPAPEEKGEGKPKGEGKGEGKPKGKGLSDERKHISDLTKKIKDVPEAPDIDLEQDEDGNVKTDGEAYKEFVENLSTFYDSMKGLVSEFASLLPNSPITEAIGTQVGAIEDVNKHFHEQREKKFEEADKKLKEYQAAEKKLRDELAKGEQELAKKLDELHRELDDDADADPVAEQLGIKEPPRPPVDRPSVEAALSRATDAFGSAGARRLLEKGYHPQDIDSLVDTFEASRTEVKDPRKYIESVDYFEPNPDRVKPPKTWEKDGEEVPFAELSDEEQAEAYRQHQMQVVGLSLAAQSNVASKAMEAGVPEQVAEAVARVALQGSDQKTAESLGRRLYDAAMGAGRVEGVDDRKAAKMMKALEGTAGATAMAGYLQAGDYYSAREALLEDPKTRITENDSAKDIAESLAELSESFEDRRLTSYPGAPDFGAATMLRTQILGKLRQLDPDKYEEVRERLSDLDAEVYEKAQESWEVQYDEWKQRKKKHERTQNIRQREKGYREQGEEREPFDEPEPQAPKKPSGYDAREGEDLSEKVRERTARRVAHRFISTYPLSQTMGNSHQQIVNRVADRSRQSVYHGVEPEAVDPYPQWSQADPHDLEDEEKALLDSVVKRAQQWLKDEATDELPRDGAMRAALDYAIEEHGLRRVIDSMVYYKLLARLAGENPDQYGGETLTARTQGAPKMSGTKLASADVPVIEESLTRLDKMAQWIQDSHEQWGLDFKVAKQIVNGLDKVADRIEKVAFGEESMTRRQAEVVGVKQADVIEQEPDEPYMGAYENTMDPIQTEADEPYMSQYDDDQSSAVGSGVDSAGRPLVPHYG